MSAIGDTAEDMSARRNRAMSSVVLFLMLFCRDSGMVSSELLYFDALQLF